MLGTKNMGILAVSIAKTQRVAIIKIITLKIEGKRTKEAFKM